MRRGTEEASVPGLAPRVRNACAIPPADLTQVSALGVEAVNASGVLRFGRPDWQRHALCRGRTDDFFAEYLSPSRVRMAKASCAQCTVRHECLNLAMSFDLDRWGIFGGLTPRERAVLRNTEHGKKGA